MSVPSPARTSFVKQLGCKMTIPNIKIGVNNLGHQGAKCFTGLGSKKKQMLSTFNDLHL